jgi:hypothetical protein
MEAIVLCVPIIQQLASDLNIIYIIYHTFTTAIIITLICCSFPLFVSSIA